MSRSHTPGKSLFPQTLVVKEILIRNTVCAGVFDVVIPTWDLKKHQGREDTRTLGFNG